MCGGWSRGRDEDPHGWQSGRCQRVVKASAELIEQLREAYGEDVERCQTYTHAVTKKKRDKAKTLDDKGKGLTLF